MDPTWITVPNQPGFFAFIEGDVFAYDGSDVDHAWEEYRLTGHPKRAFTQYGAADLVRDFNAVAIDIATAVGASWSYIAATRIEVAKRDAYMAKVTERAPACDPSVIDHALSLAADLFVCDLSDVKITVVTNTNEDPPVESVLLECDGLLMRRAHVDGTDEERVLNIVEQLRRGNSRSK